MLFYSLIVTGQYTWLSGFLLWDDLVDTGKLMARIHGATLRAILRATSVTRRGYTVATFLATLRAIFDQRLPSSHAMMLTSRNCTFVKPNINIYTETKRPFAAFPRATATPCRHASNIKLIKEVNENIQNKTFVGYRTSGKA